MIQSKKKKITRGYTSNRYQNMSLYMSLTNFIQNKIESSPDAKVCTDDDEDDDSEEDMK